MAGSSNEFADADPDDEELGGAELGDEDPGDEDLGDAEGVTRF